MGILDFFTGHQPPLIRAALEDICAMLDTGRDMFAASSAHLFDNEILDVDLVAMENSSIERGQALRRAVIEHLSIDPKRELILCLKLLLAVQDGERIASLARALGFAASLAQHPRLGPSLDMLRTLRDETLTLFDRVKDCFVEGDVEKGQDVLATQQRVWADLNQCLRQISQADSLVNESVACALGAQAVSRVGAHLANIAHCVVAPLDKIHLNA